MKSDNSDINRRIKSLNKVNNGGKCILYVMSRDQRVNDNYALLAAQEEAMIKKLPLAVVFCLSPNSGNRSKEHYQWMIAGLGEVENALLTKNIPFLMLIGDPKERINGCIRHLMPEAVYFDFNPLRGPSKLQNSLSTQISCQMYVVDTHNIVPCWVTSEKQEYSARTIRPKIHRFITEYLVEPNKLKSHPISWQGPVMKIKDLHEKISAVLDGLHSNGQTDLRSLFPTGESFARNRLTEFLDSKFKNYYADRNNPTIDGISGLSPYLHFGQISSQRVILEALSKPGEDTSLTESYNVLFEEIVVRKELSDNFCYFNKEYDSLGGASDWAKATISKHRDDDREYLYSRDEFENAKTHDPAWNAAQNQLRFTGKMHGYMRMYWAKKVLEWSPTPEQAIATLIYLNDFYSIDGGDPNGYTGIMWSVAGVHDRPWAERPVSGTVRNMVYSGLERKFDVNKYIEQWV